jgi:hypothetical protein
MNYVPIEAGINRPLLTAPEPGDPLIASTEPNTTPAFPTSLIDLPYTGTLSSLLEARLAAQLGIPVAGIELTAGRSVFVQQFQRYAWIVDGGRRVMHGVAVRWLVEIQKIDVQAKLNSLAMLAASAQLGYVNATVRFDVIGIISKEIDAAIPAPTVLSVETHAEYAEALKRITNLMWDNSVTVRPQPLSIGVDRLSMAGKDVQQGWVYFKIASGQSLRKTLADLIDPTPELKTEIEQIYRDIASPVSEDAAPSDEVKSLSNSALKHFSFK